MVNKMSIKMQKDKGTFKNMRDQAAQDVRFFLPENIMNRWHPEIHASESNDESTINIYDIVGEDFWTGNGMTSKVVSSILRKNKGKPVTVNINSPGGDFFEGLAIYNLLKEHDSDITVRIVGIAASAASIIAMAGDTVKIAESGFIMIHNVWTVCVGNKDNMRECMDTLTKFDESSVGIYAKKTGMDSNDIADMMAAETWISGADAVENGFATGFLDSDELGTDGEDLTKKARSLKEIEQALAKAGKTRSQRRAIIKDLTSTPGAAVNEPVKPCADSKLTDALASFLKTLETV